MIEINLETRKGSRGRIFWNFWTEESRLEILDYLENDGISGNFTLK